MDGIDIKPPPRARVVRRTEALMGSWVHVMDEDVHYEEAVSREYWSHHLENLRPGDRIEVHSFDRRIVFFLQILEVNTATDPVYFEFAALPFYPPDLHLPAVAPQQQPRYAVRQAPGGGGVWNVIDLQSGAPVNANPFDRHRAMELASSLERGLAQGAEQLATEAARHQAASPGARRTKAAARTARWREKQRAEAAAAAPDEAAA